MTALCTAICTVGCASPRAHESMNGSTAMRRVNAVRLRPLIEAAFEARSPALVAALDHSLAWLDDSRSRAFFPPARGTATHRHVRASVVALRSLLLQSEGPHEFAEAVLRDFDFYEAVGSDGRGRVLFTAYFAPEYAGSRTPSDRFRYPLYGIPSDSGRDGQTDLGQATRAEIETGDLLAGCELVWLEDALDAYLVHVNGSARIRLEDGSFMLLGHAGTNERAYTSLGRLLIEAGMVPAEEMSMQAIRAAHRRHPAMVEAMMRRNDRFVFFRELAPPHWPLGSLRVPLTAEVSIATDKSLFPAGGVALMSADVMTASGRPRPVARLVVDQDSGGAITGPGRVDLYMGVGAEAGAAAGRQNHDGRLYYLLLKHDGVD